MCPISNKLGKLIPYQVSEVGLYIAVIPTMLRLIPLTPSECATFGRVKDSLPQLSNVPLPKFNKKGRFRMKTKFDLIKMKLIALFYFPLSAVLKIRTWQQYFQWLQAPVCTLHYLALVPAEYLHKSTFM